MLRKLLISLLMLLMVAGCATRTATSGRVAVRNDSAPAAPAGLSFQERDRAIVTEYYRPSKRKMTMPTAVKREQLPPGFGKRDTLPSSLHGQLLPADLEARLSAVPGAYVRVLVGRDMVLMHRNTRLVTDILYGVTK